jgi:uncharacterized membrane protein
MLNSDQIAALHQLTIVPFVVAALIAYQFHRTSESRHGLRYTVSVLHPLLFPAAALFAVLASARTTRESSQSEVAIFFSILVVGLAGMVASTFPFRGRWWLPAVHLSTLAVAAWCWFLGSMILYHDSI